MSSLRNDLRTIAAFKQEMAELSPDSNMAVDSRKSVEGNYRTSLRHRVLMGLGLTASSIVLIIAGCSDRDSDSSNKPAKTETGADCTDETTTYIITDDDTYWGIAEEHLGKTPARVTAVEVLRDLNPDHKAGALQEGDEILIPADFEQC